MADLLHEIENKPAAYPAAPSLSSAAAALDANSIWERIENYIRTRYTERQVVWIVEACHNENWTPPLSPVVSLSAEVWTDGAWVSTDLTEAPLGYTLPKYGTFRITAQVGAGEAPNAISEAFRRMAEYSVERFERAGAMGGTVSVGSINLSYSRTAAHAAKALQYSGAADLLRPYRRQK